MNDYQKFLAHTAYSMRVNSLKMTTHAGSGHPTSALSAADLVSVLFFDVMQMDLNDSTNPNNDRFILSKGHASPLFYAVYKELGVLTQEQLMTYRDFDSPLEGHPVPRFAWTEAATGSLGQGLSVGVGMALNAKMDGREYRTFVLMGDSEVAEGSIWEAAELAAYYKLNNLVGILDVNRLGQRGETMEGWDLDDYAKKFAAFGWQTFMVDGHDIPQIVETFDKVKDVDGKPSIIIAKTQKGYGIEGIENKNGFHGKAFSKNELPGILTEMKKRFAGVAESSGYQWAAKLPKKEAVPSVKPISLPSPTYSTKDALPTRKAFGEALVALGEQSPAVVSLDAEVSNSTYSQFFAEKFPDRFIECFIAEQNMVGMAVGFEKRGKIPFASTFAAFFTRAYDQIRMASIGQAALRLVGSHAGVSIGQDGPSQMALEDIAMMRAIHNSIVLYPSDAVATWKLLGLMANRNDGISYMRTTRAATQIIYENNEAFEIGGCKVLHESDDDVACIVAAGITLSEALKAYELLKSQGIRIAVIDLYSIKPLDAATVMRVAQKAQKKIITVEDHYLQGGLGEAVVSALKNDGLHFTNLAVSKMARSGKPEELLAFEEIDASAIMKTVKAL